MAEPTIQDFSLVKTKVSKYATDFALDPSNAFYYLILELVLDLQDDEIENSITDNYYLQQKAGKTAGHDQGIDAVYIEYDESGGKTPEVHLFNCKYTVDQKNMKKNYPASEIDKISSFLHDLMNKQEALRETINIPLYSKVEEIWALFDKAYPNFYIHLCANCAFGFTEKDRKKLERVVGNYSNIEIKYHLLGDLVDLIRKGKKRKINARLKVIDNNFFEISDGDLRALIAHIDIRELIRIVVDDDSLRDDCNLTDYNFLKKSSILNDAFEDNVRVYLKSSKINRSIKETALSEENYRFFYFNNGITITCDKFHYQRMRSPVITLANIQIVNGAQTINALYEAFLERDSSEFENVDILCRIYEVDTSSDPSLKSRVATCTNSQNPVKSRDVRSIDFIQQKLEKEFLVKEYYYERKKDQYVDKPKHLRLDAEKVGQVLMSFYNKMPREATNRKIYIFGDRYEEIFTNSINAEKILLPYKLYEKIEEKKREIKKQSSSNPQYSQKYFIVYSSYYMLYIISEIAHRQAIDFDFISFDEFNGLYPQALGILEAAMQEARKSYQESGTSDASFLKTSEAKKLIDKHLDGFYSNFQ